MEGGCANRRGGGNQRHGTRPGRGGGRNGNGARPANGPAGGSRARCGSGVNSGGNSGHCGNSNRVNRGADASVGINAAAHTNPSVPGANNSNRASNRSSHRSPRTSSAVPSGRRGTAQPGPNGQIHNRAERAANPRDNSTDNDVNARTRPRRSNSRSHVRNSPRSNSRNSPRSNSRNNTGSNTGSNTGISCPSSSPSDNPSGHSNNNPTDSTDNHEPNNPGNNNANGPAGESRRTQRRRPTPSPISYHREDFLAFNDPTDEPPDPQTQVSERTTLPDNGTTAGTISGTTSRTNSGTNTGTITQTTTRTTGEEPAHRPNNRPLRRSNRRGNNNNQGNNDNERNRAPGDSIDTHRPTSTWRYYQRARQMERGEFSFGVQTSAPFIIPTGRSNNRLSHRGVQHIASLDDLQQQHGITADATGDGTVTLDGDVEAILDQVFFSHILDPFATLDPTARFLNTLFSDVVHDARRPDSLMCPTCMMIHSPVEGSRSIAIVGDEGGGGNERITKTSDSDSLVERVAEGATRVSASSSAASIDVASFSFRSDVLGEDEISAVSSMLSLGSGSSSEVSDPIPLHDEEYHSARMSERDTIGVESVSSTITYRPISVESVSSHGSSRAHMIMGLETSSSESNFQGTHVVGYSTVASSESFTSLRASNGGILRNPLSNANVVTPQVDADDSLSLFADDWGDMATASTDRDNHIGMRFINALHRGTPPEASGDNAGNDNEPTNPLTHLRDYGGLRVFATATCPICLEEHNPVVALKCGHTVCEEDFRKLGGYLASDDNGSRGEQSMETRQADTTADRQTLLNEDNEREIGVFELMEQTTQRETGQGNTGRNRRRRRTHNLTNDGPIPNGARNAPSNLGRRVTATNNTPSPAMITDDNVYAQSPIPSTTQTTPQTLPNEALSSSSATNPSAAPTSRVPHSQLTEARGRLRNPMTVNPRANGRRSIPTNTGDHATMRNNAGRHSSLTRVERRERGGSRGKAWAWISTNLCQHASCCHGNNLHKQLWSVGTNSLSLTSCYPHGSTVIPDGVGGVWIRKACNSTTDWDLLHKNKNREVVKFSIHKDAKIVADGIGGVWSISPHCCDDGVVDENSYWDLFHFTSAKREKKHVASVPPTTQIFSGRGGKAWVLVILTDECHQLGNLDCHKPLTEGLWVVGHRSEEYISLFNGYYHGCLEPDGYGNIWALDEENNSDDSLLLKHFYNDSRCDISPIELMRGARLYGCDCFNGTYAHCPSSNNSNNWNLYFIEKDPTTGEWEKTLIMECSPSASIASDGNGGLWVMIPNENSGEMTFWRATKTGLGLVHAKEVSHEGAQLISG